MNTCYKCVRLEEHPWHDDGTDNHEHINKWINGSHAFTYGHESWRDNNDANR